MSPGSGKVLVLATVSIDTMTISTCCGAGDWHNCNLSNVSQKNRLREAFKKIKSINKVNVLICLDPLPPPPNKEKKLGNFFIILDPLPPP